MLRYRTRLQKLPRLARQRGQALIFGLFVLVAGLAGMFFMFNTGQLTAEKTKLINTADAVAYSAAVMHARALNFDAYTNRALIANEVLVAQMVSVSSWMEYAEDHNTRIYPLNCGTITYSVPTWRGLPLFASGCFTVTWSGEYTITTARQIVDPIAEAVVAAVEVSKVALQAAQSAAFLAFLPARKSLMEQVADANYAGLGPVKVDTVPLQDNYTLFEGGPFIKRNSGNDRSRFREVEINAADKDKFVSKRGWSESTVGISPCLIPYVPSTTATHTSKTKLTGYDSWEASDSARMYTQKKMWVGSLPPKLKCVTTESWQLGSGKQSAKKNNGDWYYSGVPSFYDLSTAALDYKPNHSNPDKRDLRLKFAVRLTRGKADLRTSSGTSLVKPTGQMAIFEGDEAKDVMAAVSSSEVYFERPAARADGRTELPSLFNPYWQAHLIGNSAAVKAAALALQNP